MFHNITRIDESTHLVVYIGSVCNPTSGIFLASDLISELQILRIYPSNFSLLIEVESAARWRHKHLRIILHHSSKWNQWKPKSLIIIRKIVSLHQDFEYWTSWCPCNPILHQLHSIFSANYFNAINKNELNLNAVFKNNLTEIISINYHYTYEWYKYPSIYLNLDSVPFHSQFAVPLIIGFQLISHASFHKSKNLARKTVNQRHTLN